jgi:glucosamine--fructose-6-phosphate aminotransferase (isomerizing)
MCGIVGIVSKKDSVAADVLRCLRTLEYRGYDSAGIATVTATGEIDRVRAEGKLRKLEEALEKHKLSGSFGIGHTRWATHGAPSEANAHPHSNGIVAVVHNGIIENFQELRQQRQNAGDVFTSETDTEVVVHLLSSYLAEGLEPKLAMQKLLSVLGGAFALAILFAGKNPRLFVARRGSPLALGIADGARFCASDAYALAAFTSQIIYLEDDDFAEITADNLQIWNKAGDQVQRQVQQTLFSGAAIGKGNFRHFMQKEIFEQPTVIGDTINALVHPMKHRVQLPKLPLDWKKCSRVTIVACGTSYYAGMVAKYWFERIARISAEVVVASEFRYAYPVFSENGLTLCISQSGETADTLAALHFAKHEKQASMAIVNVENSSLARTADAVLRTLAGPEIGVASTKAFTTQLVTLACLTLAAAEARGALSDAQAKRYIHALMALPSHISEALQLDAMIQNLAPKIAKARDVLYIGRGTGYPIALEGALKLKEISYIHAEGLAAGELKHGPIALIDKNVPVIAIAPDNSLFEKTASNIREVAARGGQVILLSSRAKIEELKDVTNAAITLPAIDPWLAPILYTIPVQLLAYHVAVLKGTDVDQPRNLAKSVTVE